MADFMYLERKLEDIANYSRGMSFTSSEGKKLLELLSILEHQIKLGMPFEREYNCPVVQGCQHKNKYLNKISPTMSFWVCPDCGEEVK